MSSDDSKSTSVSSSSNGSQPSGSLSARGEIGSTTAIVPWTSRSMETCYRQACAYYDVKPDPSIYILLKTQSSVIRPQKKYEEEHVLPLVDLLAKLHLLEGASDSRLSGIKAKSKQFVPFHFDEVPSRFQAALVAAEENEANRGTERSDSETIITSSSIPRNPQRPAFNITWLQLGKSRIGSNGATLLGKLLELNPALTALDISDNMIGPRGARALARGVSRNTNVCWLDLHSNRFYLKGAEALTDAIRSSSSLTYLNVSNCHIGFAGLALMTLAVTQKNSSLLPLEGEAVAAAMKKKSVPEIPTTMSSTSSSPLSQQLSPVLTPSASSSNLQAQAKAKTSLGGGGCRNHPRGHLYVNMDGNLVYEEVFNSLTHGIGILLALIGTYFMTSKAAAQGTPQHTFGAAIFSFAVLMLYTSSCLFHSFFKLGTAKIIFQVMDHSAIFVMIAGTYTPVLMIPLHGPHAYLLLAVLWLVAVIGIAQDIYFFNPEGVSVFSLVLYLVMGWLCVIIARPVATLLPLEALIWILVGGLMYTFGVPFYVLGEKVKYIYHTVWHCFVLAASICHYIALYFYIIPLVLPEKAVELF